jgi:hypothetical protein
MDMLERLDHILTDLALWNNEFNKRGYLSIIIGDYSLSNNNNMINVNNEYWNANDGDFDPIDIIRYANGLIDGSFEKYYAE